MPLYIKNKAPDADERLKMSTYRVPVYLFVGNSQTPIKCFCFVADLTKKSADIYLNQKTSVWTKVRIAFQTAEDAPFQGKVVWSQRYAFDPTTKSKRFNNWRCGIQFVFASEPERVRYLEFYDNVRKRFSADAYKMLEAETVEDKGTLDALDDLDSAVDELAIGAKPEKVVAQDSDSGEASIGGTESTKAAEANGTVADTESVATTADNEDEEAA